MSIHLVIVLILVNEFLFSYLLVLVRKKVVDDNYDDCQQSEHRLSIFPSVALIPRQDERLCQVPVGKTKFPCEAGQFRTSAAAQKSLPFINLPPGTVSERGGGSLRELCEMAQGRDWKRIINAP